MPQPPQTDWKTVGIVLAAIIGGFTQSGFTVKTTLDSVTLEIRDAQKAFEPRIERIEQKLTECVAKK